MSLIIDDGAPLDPLILRVAGLRDAFLVPAEFTAKVADTLERFDLRGKMTIIPMPSCLGRIDRSLRRVPGKHLEGFLKIVRERIAPRFDITPEFLTHLNAYSLEEGRLPAHLRRRLDVQAPLEEVVQYFTLAFQILKNVGPRRQRHHFAVEFRPRRGAEVRPGRGRGPVESLPAKV